MSALYLISIVISALGLLFIDYRLRLVVFKNRLKAVRIIGLVMLVLLGFDFAGIELGIFFSGESQYMSGLYIAPDVPIEEIGLLFIIAYQPLLIASWLKERTDV